MKKWCVLILIVSCSLLLFEKPKEVLEPTFDAYESNDFVIEKIDISNTSITTHTITSLLGTISLHRIVYEVPKLYMKKFGAKCFEYSFQNISNERGLSNVEKDLQKKLKNMGGGKEAERISFYGVKLNLIEVYGRIDEIEALKQKLKNY